MSEEKSERKELMAHDLSQSRGDDRSYAIYYESMDATSRIKVAATTPHIPFFGASIIDFGMGTGSTSFDLANLSPHNTITGVDFDPKSIEHATAKYKLPNLNFVQGDIGKVVFEPESIDVALYSSVIHEMPCYCDESEKFTFAPVARVLDSAQQQLKVAGKIIIRDFVAPFGPEEIILELNASDGNNDGSITELSTAALFKKFINSFRSSRFPKADIYTRVQQIQAKRCGWENYRLPLKEAAEFILRRAYVDRWEEEIVEEYNFWDQKKAETEISSRGFRIILSQENHNIWRHHNHFEGKFNLYNLNNKKLPYPPTNYTLVAEKVEKDQGVSIKLNSFRELATHSYLQIRIFEGIENGKKVRYEMVERPNPVLDIVPYFRYSGDIYVVVKSGYPRPIVALASDCGLLDRSTTSGYIAEPIAIGSLNITAKEVDQQKLNQEFLRRTGLSLENHKESSDKYFCSSPGGISELVISRTLHLDLDPSVHTKVESYSKLSTSGDIRAFEARQLLRSSQIGGMFDSRLEIAIYNILIKQGLDLGPWIGFMIDLEEQENSPIKIAAASDLLALKKQIFTEAKENKPLNFLSIKEGEFFEYSSDKQKIADVKIEYVEPRSRSNSTVSILPVAFTKSGLFVGLETRNLPAPQIHFDSSLITTAPAFRLSRNVDSVESALEELKDRFKNDFGGILENIIPLGGKYFPCAGILPEVVYPFIAEIDLSKADNKGLNLTWVELGDLLRNTDRIFDGHLLTLLYRSLHMLKQSVYK